ncbi:hypothetical protein [Devosia sp.]|uniref:hypothetical protein n=1 Tax=Devosia sp. TaxID=1871048 RepID=UPI001A065C06|nr:hypothetical protein [Devosia sp.]MBE0577833.1 hypothetical protein [Devosia sp.]
MSGKPVGRQVAVVTKFQTEAVKPGGVDRRAAGRAAEQAVADMQVQVQQRVLDSLEPLVALLRQWQKEAPAAAVRGACDWAATTRDLAGLAEMHLLTEVAMHSYDCLDAVAVDGASMDANEAACFADALVFARQDACRGSDLTPYLPLLKDLETLTTLVIGRGVQAG